MKVERFRFASDYLATGNLFPNTELDTEVNTSEYQHPAVSTSAPYGWADYAATYRSGVIDSGSEQTRWFLAEWVQSLRDLRFSFEMCNAVTLDGNGNIADLNTSHTSYKVEEGVVSSIVLPYSDTRMGFFGIDNEKYVRRRYGRWNVAFLSSTGPCYIRDMKIFHWVPEEDQMMAGTLKNIFGATLGDKTFSWFVGALSCHLADSKMAAEDFMDSYAITNAVDQYLLAHGNDLRHPPHTGMPPEAYRAGLLAIMQSRGVSGMSQGYLQRKIGDVLGVDANSVELTTTNKSFIFSALLPAANIVNYGVEYPNMPGVNPSRAAPIIADLFGCATTIHSTPPRIETAFSLTAPKGLAYKADGSKLYVSSGTQVWQWNGTALTLFAGAAGSGAVGNEGPATSAHFGSADSLAVDSVGNVYISDNTALTVRYVDTSGVIHAYAGNGTQADPVNGASRTATPFQGLLELAVGPDDDLYIADGSAGNVMRVHSDTIMFVAGLPGTYGFGGDGSDANVALFNVPGPISVAPDGTLYICDVGNRRVRVVNTDGVITTFAGNGNTIWSGDGFLATHASIGTPGGVAATASTVYISDVNHDSVRGVNVSSGIIVATAGNHNNGYSGDGGQPNFAKLNVPRAIAVSLPNKTISFVEWGNSVVRSVIFA